MLLPVDEYRAYATSVVSLVDVDLLKRAIISSDDDTAAEIALRLFTRGGIGDLSGALRPRLVLIPGPDDDFIHTAALIMAQCVRHLFDGAALRCLFDFSYRDEVQAELTRLASEFDPGRINQLLQMDMDEQVASILAGTILTPSDRKLRVLRAYAKHDRVFQFLSGRASAGRVEALLGMMFHNADPVSWDYFDVVTCESEIDRRYVLNAALENVWRGADLLALERSHYFKDVSNWNRKEYEAGLACIKRTR